MNKILLEAEPIDKEVGIGLFHLPNNSITPYVTWAFRLDSPNNTFWGHYFQTLEAAQEDFEKRTFTEKKEWKLVGILTKLDAPLEEIDRIRREARGF